MSDASVSVSDPSATFQSLSSTYNAALNTFNTAREQYLDSIKIARSMFTINNSVVDPVNSTSVSGSTVSSMNECAVKCSNAPSCSGATYNSTNRSCSMYSGTVRAKPGGETQTAIVRKSTTYLDTMNSAIATLNQTGAQLGSLVYASNDADTTSANSSNSNRSRFAGSLDVNNSASGSGSGSAGSSSGSTPGLADLVAAHRAKSKSGGSGSSRIQKVQQLKQNVETDVKEKNTLTLLLHIFIYLLLVVLTGALIYNLRSASSLDSIALAAGFGREDSSNNTAASNAKKYDVNKYYRQYGIKRP